MNLLAFDIGGSSVKYGLWKNEKLAEQDSFPLPKDWIEMKQILKQIFDQKSQVGTLAGVAFSAPGVVDDKKGRFVE